MEVVTLIAAQHGKHPEKRDEDFIDNYSNPKYGICSFPTNVTPHGTCGGTNKYTYTNRALGTCRSPLGFCGSAAAHCGQGCYILAHTCLRMFQGLIYSVSQASYGKCTTTNIPSNNVECGVNKGRHTCARGSLDGMCCIASSFW